MKTLASWIENINIKFRQNVLYQFLKEHFLLEAWMELYGYMLKIYLLLTFISFETILSNGSSSITITGWYKIHQEVDMWNLWCPISIINIVVIGGNAKVVKEEEGIIIEIFKNDIAKVKVGRHNECKNCGACPGDSSVVIEAQNLIGAKTGQRIAFQMKETNMLMAAFVVYIAPLVAIVIGVIVGQIIAIKLGYSVRKFQIGGGIITFILSIINIKFFDKYAHNNDKMQPVITRILS